MELLSVLHNRFPGISNALFQDRLGALLGCVINQYIGSSGINPYTSRSEMIQHIIAFKPLLTRPKILVCFVLSILQNDEASILDNLGSLMKVIYYTEKSRSLQNTLIYTLRKCYVLIKTPLVSDLLENEVVEYVVDDIQITQVEQFHINVEKLLLLKEVLLNSARD